MPSRMTYFLIAAAFGPAWYVALRLWPPTNDLLGPPGLLIPANSPLRVMLSLTLTSLAVAVLVRPVLRSGSGLAVAMVGLGCLWGGTALFTGVWCLAELVAGGELGAGGMETMVGFAFVTLIGATTGAIASLPISLFVGALELVALRSVARRDRSAMSIA